MSTAERVAAVLARVRAGLDRGEPLDADAVVRAHPDLTRPLRRALAALRDLDVAYRGAPTSGPSGPSSPSLVGRSLGAYRIESVLGSGGMGKVYRAVDVSGRTRSGGGPAVVAVKVVHPHLLERASFVERFLREAEIGQRVRHENVVRTLDVGEVDVGDEMPVRFLVMEHVEGRTLRSLLTELSRLPEELCRHIGREVAKGLAAIHAAGVVHRDVKPDNVLITNDHVVKVMDLGVARLADEAMRLSQTGAFVGSVRYGAPEQFHARAVDVDGRADLYGFGLTLYELATGRHPFDGDDVRAVMRQQMSVAPRPAAELNPQLSPFFEDVLRCLLEKDREARFASADALLEALVAGEDSPWWHARAKSIRDETRRPLRRIRIPRETALHGRDVEIVRLRSLYEKAKAGDGQVVLVEGEAGIGKSRLVDEFVGSLAQAGEDVNFLYGSYPPGGAATASGAFTSAYREHLGDDDSAIRAALPQTPLLVPAFAALLRGDIAPAGAEPLTKDSLQTVFVHATRSFSAQRPTIVLIDDLHFAPEEGRALFASLALSVPGHRILLVGGARPALDEKWVAGVAGLPQLTRMPLARLGAKDLVRLLHDALKSQHLAEELAGKIATKSDGNPFFVFEILRGLREGQFLTRRPDGSWVTTREIRELEVPSSIVDVVQARVSDLDRGDRDLLEAGACVGFEFDAALVSDVLGTALIPSLQRLGAIEKRHRLVRSVGHCFAFDHHQVQEVLYGGLSAPLREAYHARIAEAIETRTGAASKEPEDLDGAVCVDLAQHLLNGAKGERALRYLDAALTHLERSYLNDAAIRLADRALAAPTLLAGKARCKILLRTAARLRFVGRRESISTTLGEARVLADAAGDAALRFSTRMELGRFLVGGRACGVETQHVIEEALAISRQAANRRSEAVATNYLGLVYLERAQYDEARSLLERHLAMSREIGFRQGEAAAAGNLGTIFRSLGRLDLACRYGEQCLAAYRDAGDRRGEATALGNLGNSLSDLGWVEDARRHHERSLAIGREIGSRPIEAGAARGLSHALFQLGRYHEGRSLAERSLAIDREVGDKEGEAATLWGRGNAWLVLGDANRAREDLSMSLAISQETGDRFRQGVVLVGLGRAAQAQDDAAGAERLFSEALALQREITRRDAEAWTLLARGALFASQGREAEARGDLETALGLAVPLDLATVSLLATAALAVLPRGDVAAALTALSVHERRVAREHAMEARFLAWRATRGGGHLAEAKCVLDHLVAHSPPEYRESMVANVRLHREITAAAREHGIS